jgi:ATP-dependent DNA helicase RecG
VYIGIQDDNPAVAGKGIEHLRRHGVSTHMFDRDLQDVILEVNKTFFKWARKQPAKPEEEPIKLSKYEDAVEAVDLHDLAPEALKRYQSKAGIVAKVGSNEFRRLFQQQGLAVDARGKPSGFGLLLFGKKPRNAMPQAGLLARADFPDGTSARKEFGEALVLIPMALERWLGSVLPSTIDRRQMERRERVDLPFSMIREAVVNALVHRDYNIAGQKCQLIINADTIVVKSPGGPIPPTTLGQLQSFSAPMISRNPILHYVFARMGMAEEQGFGLEQSLKREAERLGLPLPSFTMEGDYLVLTIYRNKKAAIATLPEKVRRDLSEAESAGWEWLTQRQTASSAEYAKAQSIPARTAQNHLKHFVELRLVDVVGSARATRYAVRKS